MYNREDMICSFCVNDYHLAMMLVPYIYEVINEGKRVITFLDRDLEEVVEKVIVTNKKYWDDIEKFKDIDWRKTRFDKLSDKFRNIENSDVVIIAGKNIFIERTNRLLINFHINFTIVNCFNIVDIEKDENFKISDYAKILNTKGLEKIEDMNLV